MTSFHDQLVSISHIRQVCGKYTEKFLVLTDRYNMQFRQFYGGLFEK